MKLRIGTNFSLPVEAVTETFAILAKRGVGKTYTAKKMAEQMLKAAIAPVVVVDPVGVWWGLRSAADGKGPGLPILVLGGDYGDAPLDVGSGEIVATMIVEDRLSAVLDLSKLRKNEQTTFMTAFSETLYRINREALHLMLDEADAFAPQKPYKGQERLLGAMEDLVRRGRARGIGVTLITQRAAVINKDVLTQAEVLVALRTIAPQDRAAIEAWIRVHGTEAQGDELMASLPSLPIGTAWFWSPGWLDVFVRVAVERVETFDSSATPKAGHSAKRPKELAPVDIAAVRQRLASQIERAKADDPKALRAEIARLTQELQRKPAAAPDKGQLDAVATQAMKEASLALGRKLQPMLERVSKGIGAAVADLRAVADHLDAEKEFLALSSKDIKFTIDMPRLVPTKSSPPAPRGNTGNSGNAGNSGNGGVAQRILDAVAELEALGVREPPRVFVAFLAGYTNLASKGFVNALGSLRTASRIDYPSPGTVGLTGAGRAMATAVQAPRSTAELQSRLIGMLGGANGRIVQHLVDVYPNSLAREDLAGRAGYSHTASKGFANAIGRLRSLGFIDYPERGQIRASNTLFLKH